MTLPQFAADTGGAASMDPSLRWGDGGWGDGYLFTPSFQRRLESIVMTHERRRARSPGAAGMDPSLRWGDGG